MRSFSKGLHTDGSFHLLRIPVSESPLEMEVLHRTSKFGLNTKGA